MAATGSDPEANRILRAASAAKTASTHFPSRARTLRPHPAAMTRPTRSVFALLLVTLLAAACSEPQRVPPPPAGDRATTPAAPAASTPDTLPVADAPTGDDDRTEDPMDKTEKTELATFGGGCFWCTEAVLEQLDGVLDVVSGYTGGHVDNPNYRQVCDGDTGHAEVVQVTFDPQKIRYETLLEWFFRSHDPTTLNRQGADVGTQYRSAIFTHSQQQHDVAVKLIESIQQNFDDPIVTELTPIETFWPAEAYHQDYFRNNPDQGYCRVVIKPKLKKLDLDYEPKK